MKSQAILIAILPILILAVIGIYSYANFIYSQSITQSKYNINLESFLIAKNSFCLLYKELNKSPSALEIENLYNQISSQLGNNLLVFNNTIEYNNLVATCYG